MQNPYPPMELLSAAQVEAIHQASLRILGELGIELMSPAARDAMRIYGAEVDEITGTVRFGADVLAKALETVPSAFTLTPRNPAHRVTLGGSHLVFGLVAGPPNVHDCLRGRRPGNHEDYCNFIKLAQHFNAIHVIGNQVCAPVELPAGTRHLDTYLANLVYSDRAYHCTAIGAGRALDGIRMMAIARVPTGGHFFGDAHTLQRYEHAFYQPLVSDWQSHGNWELAGAKDATQRATDVWQRALNEYEQPPMPAEIRAELEAYATQRRAAIGAGEP